MCVVLSGSWAVCLTAQRLTERQCRHRNRPAARPHTRSLNYRLLVDVGHNVFSLACPALFLLMQLPQHALDLFIP